MVSFLFLAFLLLCLLCCGAGKTYRCDDVSDKSLPCVEVHACGSGSYATVEVRTLSSGAGASTAAASVKMCYDDGSKSLHFSYTASGQSSYPTNGSYSSCNDNIFYQDAVESFITGPFADPDSSSSKNDSTSFLHCYNEIDFNMYSDTYAAGIYNKNLNQSGCVNTLFDDCSSVSSRAKIGGDSWSVDFSLPYLTLNSPPGCPASIASGSDVRRSVYRGNFYRIRELSPIGAAHCSSASCEYVSWSPNFVSPPSFHQPSYFGYILLV